MPKEKDHWQTINCCEQHANEHGVLSQIKVNDGYLYKLRAAGVVRICFGATIPSNIVQPGEMVRVFNELDRDRKKPNRKATKKGKKK